MTAGRFRGLTRRAFLWTLAAACAAGGRGGLRARPLNPALIRRMATWAG